MLNIILFIFSSWTGEPIGYESRLSGDSLRLETLDGKTFIIHRIDKGETLYSISRKYRIAVAILERTNPGSGAGINIGQELKIPYQGKNPDRAPAEVTHTVLEKQTLYSIARQYGVTVDQIKEWNKLSSNSLNEGQRLIIKKISEPSVEVKQDIIKQDVAKTLPVNPPVSQPIAASLEKIEPVSKDEKNETGFALLSDRTGESRKYLAYHRTIPQGTVLRVRNKNNQKEIFVRIAGKLPDNDGNEVLIRISKAAWEKLGAVDKFPAEIIFFD